MHTRSLDAGRRLAAVAVCLALGSHGMTQDLRPRPVSRQACGLAEIDGELWGAGPDYKVHFGPDAVEFTPALGERAPRNLPLRLALTSIGRGTEHSAVSPRAVRTYDGHSVRYAHTGFDEVYEIRTDGVEQSFIFHERPEGAGDLVVRLALTTDLALAHSKRDEVRLERDGIGGVRIGAVTGIDARGARIAGALSCAGDTLELSLPAAWVDRAALPIVLDPLIGSSVTIVSAASDGSADPAFDFTHDVYLLVWHRHFSHLNSDILGQRVRADGTLVGGLLLIESDPSVRAFAPDVANVNLRDRFVVTWRNTSTNRIWIVSVHAGTGAISATAAIDTESIASVDLGSEATLASDKAVLVWSDVSGFYAAQVGVASSGTVVVSGEREIFRGFPSSPVLANTVHLADGGGTSGRYLVVLQQYPADDLQGLILDRRLATVVPEFAIAATPALESGPDVDGDGERWVVAWTSYSYQTSMASALCRGVTLDAGSRAAVLSPVVVVADDAQNVSDVGWLGDSCLISYGKDPNTWVQSIDPFGCGPCEDAFVLQHQPAGWVGEMATQLSGGGLPGKAMVVWQVRPGASSMRGTDIVFQRFDAADGVVTDFGGGCGNGGKAHATCAITGNAGFASQVRNAAPAAPASLVLSARRLDAPCGGCVLVPDPFAGLVFPAGATNSRGDAAVPIPIPASVALVGATFFQQWVIGTGSSCGTHDFSNALQVQIQ